MTHRSLARSPLLVTLALAACTPSPPGGSPAPRRPEARREVSHRVTPAPTVDRLLDSLSVRDKVAQLVMPWLAGDFSPADSPEMRQALAWVDSLKVGGIIISVGSPTEIAAKLNRLQRAAPLPLLIASDLEGGTTLRFSGGGTLFPTQMGVAAGGSLDDAYQMGRITALEGRAVGIHLAFAPVADVNSNPDNPIINTRSFGGDPAAVGRFVAATIRGMHDNGMLATAKHFPGHGDTEVDSHLSLPTITAGWRRFDTLELVPFRAAIAAGVDAIMSAHIALPGLDPGPPRAATLSPPILTGLLQDSLGFHGLITTDALNMGAIVRSVGASEAPVLAFLAGSDLLLMPTDAGSAIDAMVAAVADGRISRERLDRSVRKVLEMKQRLGLFAGREVDLDRVAEMVGRADFQRIGDAVARRSITLLKDSLGTVDSLRARRRRVTVVAWTETPSTLGSTLAAELRRAGDTVRLVRLTAGSSSAQRDSALTAIASGEITVVATAVRVTTAKGTVALPDEAARLIEAINASRPTVLVSFGSPYLISRVPSVGSYLMAWASNAVSEAAVAGALVGAPITGRSPIAIPPGYPIGAGLSRAAR